MFYFNSAVINNVSVLNRYEELKKENKEPKLGVYKGRDLVIVSFKASGILESISLFFHKIVATILRFSSQLNEEKKCIKAVKEGVNSFYNTKLKKTNVINCDNKPEVDRLNHEVERLNLAVRQLDGFNRDLMQKFMHISNKAAL